MKTFEHIIRNEDAKFCWSSSPWMMPVSNAIKLDTLVRLRISVSSFTDEISGNITVDLHERTR